MEEKTNLTIGELKGKLLLFGGVYSNYAALDKLIKIANDLNIKPSNIICTGDSVGYCAEPEKTIQTIKKWGIHSIAGNVEIQLRENQEDCGCDFDSESRCDIFSKQWYPFAQKSISKDSLEWMHTLPHFISFTYGNKKVSVVHGSYKNTSEFIFKSTPWENKQDTFDKLDSDIIIAGHCGLPFNQTKNNKTWINPGVIGMPANDGSTNVWYAILEENQGELLFSHHSFAYNHTETAYLMRENKLPEAYAKTIENGIWDNCDILPQIETEAQGKIILF